MKLFRILAMLFALALLITSCSGANNSKPAEQNPPDQGPFAQEPDDGASITSSTSIWVAPDGSDDNPGTIDRPFKTLGTALQSANGINRYVRLAGGVYTEPYGQALADGISIYGGYGPLENATRNRDIVNNVSTIDMSNCQDGTCSVSIRDTGTGNETLIDGVTIIGKGTGIEIRDSSPTIKDCTISTLGGEAGAYAVSITGLKENSVLAPNILNSTITAGDAWVSGGQSSGISFTNHSKSVTISPVIQNNSISSGRGMSISAGISGVVTDGGKANVTVTGNTIRSSASAYESVGVKLNYAGETAANASSSATITDNKIFAGDIGETTEPATGSYGIGVYGLSGPLVVAGNFIRNGQNAMWSAGVELSGAAGAKIYCNTMIAYAGSARGGAIIQYDSVSSDIESNILCAANGITGIYGMYIISSVRSAEPVRYLKNNLCCSNLGTLYTDVGISPPTLIREIASLNRLNGNSTDNIAGIASFANESVSDFHIVSGSSAIDRGRGLDTCGTDIDGQPRPNGSGPDIGADELF